MSVCDDWYIVFLRLINAPKWLLMFNELVQKNEASLRDIHMFNNVFHNPFSFTTFVLHK